MNTWNHLRYKILKLFFMVFFTEFYLNVFYFWNNIIELLDIQGEIRSSDSLEA